MPSVRCTPLQRSTQRRHHQLLVRALASFIASGIGLCSQRRQQALRQAASSSTGEIEAQAGGHSGCRGRRPRGSRVGVGQHGRYGSRSARSVFFDQHRQHLSASGASMRAASNSGQGEGQQLDEDPRTRPAPNCSAQEAGSADTTEAARARAIDRSRRARQREILAAIRDDTAQLSRPNAPASGARPSRSSRAASGRNAGGGTQTRAAVAAARAVIQADVAGCTTSGVRRPLRARSVRARARCRAGRRRDPSISVSKVAPSLVVNDQCASTGSAIPSRSRTARWAGGSPAPWCRAPCAWHRGRGAAAATFCVAELHCVLTPGCAIAAPPSSETPILASAGSCRRQESPAAAPHRPSAVEGNTTWLVSTWPITRASGELAALIVASTVQSCASANSKLATGGSGLGRASSWPSTLTGRPCSALASLPRRRTPAVDWPAPPRASHRRRHWRARCR